MKDYISILRAAINRKITENPALTQSRLGQTLNLGQSQISKILSGKQTSSANLEMIASHLDVTLADLSLEAREQPDSEPSPPQESLVIGVNHEAAQPIMKNRIRDALQNSDEINISVIAVALFYSWRFLVTEIPEVLSSLPEFKRVNLNLGMVSPTLLESRKLIKWHEKAKSVSAEIEAFIDKNRKDPQIRVSLFTYDNLPHWHGILLDSSELFLGRTRWNPEGGGKWQLSVGQEPYRHYSAAHPSGLERIRMFMSWFDWYRYTGHFVASSRLEEGDE